MDIRILKEIDTKNDLHIAPYKSDGETTGTPTWIWAVLVDNQIYVRAYNGIQSRWYQSAMAQKAGIVNAAGASYQVDFSPIQNKELLDQIDQAYKNKYASSPYLSSMISNRAKAATVLITFNKAI